MKTANQVDQENVEVLDAAYHEAALNELDRASTSPEDRRWARFLVDSIQGQLAELRRAKLAEPAPITKGPPIRPSLSELDRSRLVHRLTEITESSNDSVQYAHRDLSALSDDDLRRLIDLIDSKEHDT
jgi:hypothetical protein